METIYRDLAEDIKAIEQYNQSMDSASWGYEEGILITGNDAKEILNHTAQLKADKEELLEALEEVKRLEPIICMGGAVAEQWQNEAQALNEMMSGIDSLIKKMKP